MSGSEIARRKLEAHGLSWRIDPTNGRALCKAVCKKCDGWIEVGASNMMDVSKSINLVERKTNWQYRNGKWKCVTCVAIERSERTEMQKQNLAAVPPKMATAVTVDAPKAPVVTPTMKQARTIMEVIDTHFDEANGRWKGGFSDRMAAEKLGVPAAMVTLVREDAYGPLRMPTEYEQLAADMAVLRNMVDELGVRLRNAMDAFK